MRLLVLRTSLQMARSISVSSYRKKVLQKQSRKESRAPIAKPPEMVGAKMKTPKPDPQRLPGF
jgi:hypothetical protein